MEERKPLVYEGDRIVFSTECAWLVGEETDDDYLVVVVRGVEEHLLGKILIVEVVGRPKA